MARYSNAITLVRPDNVVAVNYDTDKPDQPSVVLEPAGVMIYWGSAEGWEFYPWHRVASVRHSKIGD